MATLSVLTDAGEPVMAERLTYPAIIEAAHILNRPLIGLEMDSEGVTPDALADSGASTGDVTQAGH